MPFFTLYSSKVEVSETDFFDIFATQNDHSKLFEAFFGSMYVFFTLFWGWVLKVDSLQGGLAGGNRMFQISSFPETLLSPWGGFGRLFGDNTGA